MELNVEYLRYVLNKRGWSNRKFAMKTGLSAASICRILNNKQVAGIKSVGAIAISLRDEPREKLFSLSSNVVSNK